MQKMIVENGSTSYDLGVDISNSVLYPVARD
jgi:hypothetical protein